MPIRSRMTEWCTTRSMAAIVVMGSPNQSMMVGRSLYRLVFLVPKSGRKTGELRGAQVDVPGRVDVPGMPLRAMTGEHPISQPVRDGAGVHLQELAGGRDRVRPLRPRGDRR